MKKIVLALALALFPALAWAQCTGVFPNNTVCGNASGSGNVPAPIASTSFPSGPITIGSTVISSGTNLRVLYDANGVLGEYTNTQLTALMNLATSSLSGALPAWPNTTTTYFRGDGSYQTLNCAALTNGSASCSTDTTNASNISTGTLAASRLPAFGSGDVSFASGGGAGTIAANAVTNAKAAQAGANTLKGNWTGSTANVSDNTIPSCADLGGNHLNYVSGTGITCGTTSTGSALVLLNTLTCPNISTTGCGDTTSLTSAYSSYVIVLVNILPATTSVQCEVLVHESSTYPVTSYLGNGIEAGNTSTGQTQTTTFIPCSNTGSGHGVNSSGSGISGTIEVFNPSQTSSPKLWTVLTSYFNTASGSSFSGGGGWNGGNNAIDGFQIIFSSGNITSGTIKIYGRT